MGIRVISSCRLFRECLADYLARETGVPCRCWEPEEARRASGTRGLKLALFDHRGHLEKYVLAFIREILSKFPASQVMLLGDEDSEVQLTRYIEAGASGFISRGRSARELAEAVDSVLRYHAGCSPEQASAVFARLRQLSENQNSTQSISTSVLTDREAEVLKLIDAGRSNKEIACELHVSVHTVKSHVHNILEKLGAANRRRAVYLAHRSGWMVKEA